MRGEEDRVRERERERRGIQKPLDIWGIQLKLDVVGI